MITLAAIKKDGVVYVGKPRERHNHILCDGSRPFGFLKRGTQGFVDETGKFYTRQEAARHAFDCGQLPDDTECPKIILSEDLW